MLKCVQKEKKKERKLMNYLWYRFYKYTDCNYTNSDAFIKKYNYFRKQNYEIDFSCFKKSFTINIG